MSETNHIPVSIHDVCEREIAEAQTYLSSAYPDKFSICLWIQDQLAEQLLEDGLIVIGGPR